MQQNNYYIIFIVPAGKEGKMGTKQLNHVDRMVLQGCIEKKLPLKDTIKRLKRNRSTIYRELIKNSQSKITSQSCGYCSLFHDCNLKKSKNCDLYIPIKCTKLIKFPYVCNGCKKSPTCRLEKRYYDYYYAIENVKRIRNIHHLTVDVSFEEMRRIDNVVTPGIKKGQSLHHVYVSNPSIQFISERTIRRYLYNNYLSVKAHNLPRYVRFEHAQSKKSKYGRVKTLKNIVGRTYTDYLEYIQDLLLEWESRAEVVLTKYQDDKKLNFIQKVGRFFVNLFEKFQNWVLSVAGLTKDYKALRTFQLFDRNSSDLIKEFPAKNYYLRNFDNWKDYRVAVLKTKEDVKVDRHDKVWTPDLIVSTVSFGVAFVMILVLALTAGSVANSNRAMYTLIGIGLIIAAFLFGLRNLFFWFIFRKTRIKREKPVKPSVDSSQTGSENDEKKETKTVEKPSNVISRPSKININKPKK